MQSKGGKKAARVQRSSFLLLLDDGESVGLTLKYFAACGEVRQPEGENTRGGTSREKLHFKSLCGMHKVQSMEFFCFCFTIDDFISFCLLMTQLYDKL